MMVTSQFIADYISIQNPMMTTSISVARTRKCGHVREQNATKGNVHSQSASPVTRNARRIHIAHQIEEVQAVEDNNNLRLNTMAVKHHKPRRRRNVTMQHPVWRPTLASYIGHANQVKSGNRNGLIQ